MHLLAAGRVRSVPINLVQVPRGTVSKHREKANSKPRKFEKGTGQKQQYKVDRKDRHIQRKEVGRTKKVEERRTIQVSRSRVKAKQD